MARMLGLPNRHKLSFGIEFTVAFVAKQALVPCHALICSILFDPLRPPRQLEVHVTRNANESKTEVGAARIPSPSYDSDSILSPHL
jgi:hypothetical protein